MKPANDENFDLETISDWFFSILVTIGATTMFVVALAVTL